MSLLLLMGDSTPSIGSLFASGEAGLALDVEAAYRRGWVYQDSAGASVSAAAGDPVGLILDTSRGGLDNLGSDLVSNGTFASDTVWSKGANWTIGSGVATKTGGAANNLTQTITSTAGLWYRITMDVTRTAGTLTVSLGTSGTTYAITATGAYTFFILAGSSTQTLTLAGDSSFAGTVDNVTARLVPGNHAYQTTSGSRPALARTPDGGRRNVLTYSEQLDNAIWTSLLSAGSSRSGGTLTKTNGGTTFAYVQQSFTPAVATYVVSFDITCTTTISNVGVRVGHVNDASSTLVSFTAGVTQRVSLTIVKSDTIGSNLVIGLDSRTNVVSGANSAEVVATINRVQLEVGSSATAYQKVGLTSDVTESGKRDCWGLSFDGSDDSLVTASTDFSAGDKMTVMAGVRKNSDATQFGIICELGDRGIVGSASFSLTGPGTAGTATYYFSSGGSVTPLAADSVSPSGFASPITNVLTASSVIATDTMELRVNGGSATTSSTDQGSGNYSNRILYIGSRSSSLRFNGLIYTLIVRGAATPTSTIADFERNLLAKRAGITF